MERFLRVIVIHRIQRLDYKMHHEPLNISYFHLEGCSYFVYIIWYPWKLRWGERGMDVATYIVGDSL